MFRFRVYLPDGTDVVVFETLVPNRQPGETIVTDDGPALWAAVAEMGLEGVVAKRPTGLYRPGYGGWVKVENPGYWRRESEVEGFRRLGARL